MTLIVMEEAIIGIVMFFSCCEGVAPSMEAASYISCGIDCRPARKTTTQRPIWTQAAPMMMAIFVTPRVSSQLTAGRPAEVMILLITPLL